MFHGCYHSLACRLVPVHVPFLLQKVLVLRTSGNKETMLHVTIKPRIIRYLRPYKIFHIFLSTFARLLTIIRVRVEKHIQVF